MTVSPTEFYRFDPLTGCNNFLSFVETLDQMSAMGERQEFSLLHADMNYLQMLNDTRGHAYGDSAIRWLEIVLREETRASTYRTGGDEFAAILTNGTRAEHEALLVRLFDRLNREGELLGIPTPAARISLIHYDRDVNISVYDVMFQLGEATLDVKTKRDRTINILHAKDLIGAETDSNNHDSSTTDTLRWIANHAISRVLYISRMLDNAQRASFQDSISGLPNMRAALVKIEKEISSRQPFTILLMDGDELTRYNNISYAAGDDMIHKISTVLTEKLRPGDFVARWRAGDEFIAVLPETAVDGALIVGNRFCSAIRDASKEWLFPTSISIGVAAFPKHGKDINTLVDNAERAMKKAKDDGKDRVVLAE